MTHKIQGYGWTLDLPDVRDEPYSFKCTLAAPMTLPPSAMAHTHAGKPATTYQVFDQGQLGSCTGNSSATMMGLVFGLSARSRLEIYYEARKLEGTVGQDAGAQIRDVLKVLGTLGAGRETWWQYDIAKFADAPPPREMTDAERHRALSYHRLTTRDDFRQCLAQGFPFVIGFTVYDAFESPEVAKTGIVSLPGAKEKALGGHAVCVIGYDSEFQQSDWAKASGLPPEQIPADVYIVRNSWGSAWGRVGNFAIDARYFENSNLADDAWTVRAK